MQNLGIWGVSALRDNAKDFQYGVFPFPLPPNGQERNIFGGWAFVANAKGKNPEEAAKFCVWAVGSMQDDCIQRVAAPGVPTGAGKNLGLSLGHRPANARAAERRRRADTNRADTVRLKPPAPLAPGFARPA
jgi:Bacterial extracellular solute-binding protein